ncbi:MAG: SBBP repeat-containing protein [Promethearchaeota archaeon]
MKNKASIIIYHLIIISLLNYHSILLFFNSNYLNNNLNSSSPKFSNSHEPEWYILWQSGFSGCNCFDFVIDSFGNYYLVGTGSADGGDIYIVKFDSNRTYQWHDLWKGYSDFGRGIALDSLGYIYVVGRTDESNHGTYDCVLLKYNISGYLEWERKWGDLNSNDKAESIAIDSKDNIYITGGTDISGISSVDLFLLKYNSTGDLLGVNTLGSVNGSYGFDITIDSEDMIYLTGTIGMDHGIGLSSDTILLKYNSSLNLLWNKTWGGFAHERGYALKFDSLSNIYITGEYSDAGQRYIFLLKFNQRGDFQWDKIWLRDVSNNSIHSDSGNDLAFDSLDNIYITGKVEGIGAGLYDTILLKYDKSGNLIENLTWGGLYDDIGMGIIIDSSDNVYICGYTNSFSGASLSTEMFLLKFSSNAGDFIPQNPVIIGYDIFLIMGIFWIFIIFLIKFLNYFKISQIE